MKTNDYSEAVEQSRFEDNKERYWRNYACLLDSKVRNLNSDIFAARQELLTQGLNMRALETRFVELELLLESERAMNARLTEELETNYKH